MTGLPENWATEPVGFLVPPDPANPSQPLLLSAEPRVIPAVYVNPDGVLSIRPWRETAAGAGGSGRPTTEPAPAVLPVVDLDPQPWLFISDQVTGEHRATFDRGYHDVSGTYWVFSPRAPYEQDQSQYPTRETPDAPQA